MKQPHIITQVYRPKSTIEPPDKVRTEQCKAAYAAAGLETKASKAFRYEDVFEALGACIDRVEGMVSAKPELLLFAIELAQSLASAKRGVWSCAGDCDISIYALHALPSKESELL